MDEDFFNYLVATGQVDDFLGYKDSEIYEALCLCAGDILNNNLNDVNEITYSEINKIVNTKSLVEEKVNNLIDKALENGGIDNTTVILLEIENN